VGVPASALINWPDDWIHSTGDDLDNIDATQLERNAVVVAAVSLYFANASEDDAAQLAAYVAARAHVRLGTDLATAVATVAEAPAGDKTAAFRQARNLVHQSHLKEAGALTSIRRIAGKGRALEAIAQAASRLEGAEGDDLEALERAFVSITGKNPPNVDLSKAEREMAARIYVPTSDLGAWLDAMEKVKGVDGLHSIMLFETYNFADGRRNAYEVYEAVAAEALSAGEWYYGRVSSSDVLEALDRATKAGAFTLKTK